MANTQLIVGAAVGLGVALVLVAVFSGEPERTPEPTASPQRTTAAASATPEPTPATPRPGTNPVLARLQAAGGVTAVPKPEGRSKLLEAADGFAHAAPSMSGKPPIRSPQPSEAGEVLRPGARWPLDRHGLQGAVREAIPQLRECYDAWAKQNPQLGGRVTVTFTIKPVEGEEGAKVTSARVADQGLGHLLMEGCIVQVFEDLRFERPADGQPLNVTYPLEFASGEKDAGSP